MRHTKITSRGLLLLLALPLLNPCALTTPTKAQNTVTGAFEGIVRDNRTGQVIGRANVEFINQATGLTIQKRADSQGRFFQGLLLPGTYTIRVSAPGYETKDTVMRLLGLRTGEVVPVPVALDPVGTSSAAATAASPTAPSPTSSPTPTPGTSPAALTAEDTDLRGGINTLDAQRGGGFVEEEIVNLPLGGTTLTRTFDELALLMPGVALPPQNLGSGAGPGVGAGVGTSGQFAVNGLRSRANNFTVDGSDNNDEDIGVRRQGFLALVPQPIESVSEYQVITLLAPARFGRNIGGQVNAISKSGGSGTHGTIYGLFNSSHLNARNFFDTTAGNAVAQLRSGGQAAVAAREFTFNDATLNFAPVNGAPVTVRDGSGGEDSFTLGQGGLAFGGPLVPGRLFYFASAEGHLLNATREANFAVPTVAERGAFRTGATGIFRDPFSDTPEFWFPTTPGGDAVFSLFPFPNNPRGVYGENTFTRTLPASAQGKILSGKFDGNFKLRGREQSVRGRYNFTDDWRDIPVTGGALFSTLRPNVRTQNFSFFFNSELSGAEATRLVFNQVRLSYGRTRLRFDESPDREFLLPSETFPDTPFLLNAPLLTNLTLPNFDPVGDRLVPNTGPVLYSVGGTTEGQLGPVGQVNIAGFSPVGVDVFNFPQRRVNNTYQFADELTMTLGRHRFTFGTDNRRTELNSDLPRNFRPLITFNGAPEVDIINEQGDVGFTGRFFRGVDLAAASAASGFFQTLTAGSDAAINLRFYQLNFYGQDEWRIRPDLSLSYGLRYEYNTPARETGRCVESSFDDPSLSLVPGLRRFIGGRAQAYEPDRNNFAPRLGVAYSPDLFGPERTTVLRAGYGVYYDQILGAVVSQSRSVFPRFVTVNLAGGRGNVFFDPDNLAPFTALSLLNPSSSSLVQPGTLNRLNPNSTLAEQIALINCIASAGGGNCGTLFGGINLGDFAVPSASGVEVTLPARRLQMPMAQHYSFTFEQQLNPDTVVSAAYVGTQGRNLLRFTTPNLGTNAILLPLVFDVSLRGANQFQPNFFGVAVAPGTRISPGGDFVGGRPEPTVGGVQIFETSGTSRYDSLQLQVQGRFRRSLRYQANYTFGKVTDDVSDVFDLAGAPALPQNSLTRAGERGPANFDVRHRFAYNFVYTFPGLRQRNAALRFLLDGLRVAGTGQFQTGQPFTVNSIYDVNLDGNLTDRLDTTEGLVVTGDRRQPLRLTTDNPVSLLAPVGEDGRVGRNTFRAGNILDLNLAVIKSLRVSETQSLTFKLDVFNFINRANFGVPVRFLEAPGFGQATETVTPGRRLQFALKYTF